MPLGSLAARGRQKDREDKVHHLLDMRCSSADPEPPYSEADDCRISQVPVLSHP